MGNFALTVRAVLGYLFRIYEWYFYRCSRKAMQFMNENLMRSKISNLNASMKMKMLENISDYPQVMETILEFQRNMEDIKHTMNKKDML